MEIRALLPLILQVSLILIVAAAGLQARWRDLECALRRPGLFLRAVVAVNVVVPLVAVVMAMLLPIDPAIKAGIVIMAVSPLAPFVPGKMLKAGAEASVAIGLFFALILLAVLIVPATFALLSELFPADARLSVGTIFRFVLVSILLPLAGGLLVAKLAPSIAPRLARLASLVGMLLLLPLVVGILYRTGGPMLAVIGDGTLAVIVVTVTAGLAAGHLLGGPEPANRMALAAAAATRHPGIAILVAHSNFDDPRVVATVALFLFTSILVSAVYQAWAKKRLVPPAAAADSTQRPASL